MAVLLPDRAITSYVTPFLVKLNKGYRLPMVDRG